MALTNNFPEFPNDLPVHSLHVIDYALLQAGDKVELQSLWAAATQTGFWYIKNHGLSSLMDSMFEIGRNTMSLSLAEKMKYWQGNDGGTFGYKASGATTIDLKGTKDNAEMFNLSVDDVMAFPQTVNKEYPLTVISQMESLIQPFTSGCHAICDTIFEIFSRKLGLPESTLGRIHSIDEQSLTEVRWIKVPPNSYESQIAVGAHTDFGSISLLSNQLGGLQVFLPGENEWKYVKPVPGYLICNIGDALNLLSGGILKSSIHRVISPPSVQSKFERWSLVFFSRPRNALELNALIEDSLAIEEATRKAGAGIYHTGVTAAQWFARRQSNWRRDNQKGVTDYLASRGTEHTQTVV